MTRDRAADQVRVAVSQILRWATRSDVRESMRGPTGRDLSLTDTWLLGAIVEQGPLRAGELAVWQGVDKSTITPQLHRLEVAGLAVRSADPDDGRATLVSATARGRRVLAEMHQAGATLFSDVLADWDAADRDQFARSLSRFAEQLVEQLAARAARPWPGG